MVDLDELDKYPANRVVIITTGSQGEPWLPWRGHGYGRTPPGDIMPGDTVIISAMPIPGNEAGEARPSTTYFGRRPR